MTDTRKLTPTQHRMLEFVAAGKERGRMLVAVIASGGNSSRTMQELRNAEYVETNLDLPTNEPDFVRVTAEGRKALG